MGKFQRWVTYREQKDHRQLRRGDVFGRSILIRKIIKRLDFKDVGTTYENLRGEKSGAYMVSSESQRAVKEEEGLPLFSWIPRVK